MVCSDENMAKPGSAATFSPSGSWGWTYPVELKRPAPGDKCREIVIPLDYCGAERLPKAVQDTANICKAENK